ncbi:LAME_0H09758g1_1 [Lachancea meyersii CBS 8951]|uniref:LAME_0H09758g1_1 n=1 Tax=Lachancea meyersii CBS 8951 TaxID=1266667 RepID=A0A1G4KFS5_9SACH|nr:LAME_0H09758g1_1 [Lachancea meyersii CBS 8951]
MSNFFRDNAHGFKPRSNIFTKLRNKDSDQDSDLSSDNTMSVHDWGAVGEKRSRLDPHDSRFLTNETSISLVKESTPIAKHRGAHAPPRLKWQEEELEITEVRSVGQDHRPEVKNSDDSNTATTTNDVLLEAFTNTQKICSNLKQELQRAKAESQQQNDTINFYKSELGKLEGKMGGHKQMLNALETRSSELESQRKIRGEQLTALRGEYDALKERVRIHIKDSDLIRKQLEEFRQQHDQCDTNMSRKTEELEHLKRELADTASVLSEEKLRNGDLMHEMKKMREQSASLMEDVLKRMESSIKKELSTLEKCVKARPTKSSQSVQELQQVREALQSAITLQLKEESKNISERVQHCLRGELSSLEGDLNERLAVNFKEFTREVSSLSRIGDGITNLSSKLQEIKNCESSKIPKESIFALQTSVNDVQSSLDSIKVSLQDYKSQIDFIGSYEHKIDGLHERLQTVALQKSEAVALLKTRDTEVEDLSNQVLHKNNAIVKLNDEEKELRVLSTRLEQTLEAKNKELLKITEELQMSRADCENKLAAQNEILVLMRSQCDRLQGDVDEINRSKSEAEREKMSAKNKAKEINEQVQNLNVEVIQLKAKELELDEENRRLRSTVEQFNLEARENADQVREYKRRVAVLENDNTSKANDALENQDKIALLEHQLQNTRKQVQGLKDQRHKVPQVKKNSVVQHQQHQKLRSPDVEQPSISEAVTVAAPTPAMPTFRPKSAGNDVFDLSSSPNDDLEMTNPSPAATKALKSRTSTLLGKALTSTKKKVLLLEESEGVEVKHRGRKKRKV